jgi:hypothetical protein
MPLAWNGFRLVDRASEVTELLAENRLPLGPKCPSTVQRSWPESGPPVWS